MLGVGHVGSMGIPSRSRDAFKPSHVGSPLRLWCESDVGITLVGSNVSQWADQSGVGAHLSQGTAGARPLYVASALAGRPVIRFDGTDDWLATSGGTNAIISLGTGYVFCVFTINAITATHASAFACDGVFANAGTLLGCTLDSGTSKARGWNFDTAYDEANNPTTGISVSVGTSYLVTWKHLGGQVSLQLNRGTPITAASGDTSAGLSGSVFEVGASWSGVNLKPSSIDVSAIVVCNADISAYESRMQSYLCGKYGVG